MNKQERIISILVQRNDVSNQEKKILQQIFESEGRLPVVGLNLQSEEKQLYNSISRNTSGFEKENEV